VAFDPNFIRTLEALNLLARKVRSGEERADRTSPRRGASLEFEDYRPYAHGDEIRYIDWNVYARHGSLFVKEFTAQEDVHVALLLDRSRSLAFGRPPKFDAAREVAAALAYIGLVNFDTVSVYSFARDLRTHRKFLRGKARIFELLDELDRMEPEGESDFRAALAGPLPRLKGRSLVVLLTDFYDPGVAEAVRSLQAHRHEVHLIHLVALEELEPPERGRFRLVDLESGREKEVTLRPATVDAYRRRFEAHCRELERMAREREISYVRVRTDEPIERRVFDIVRAGILEAR
jgi:uncharacterized protein (DUF58 family)